MLNERDYWRQGRGTSSGGGMPWERWSAVKTLLIINIAVFILCSVNPQGILVSFLPLSTQGIQRFYVWELFTYMFTHFQLYHLLGNMWSLWVFGGIVEQTLGKRRTFQLYVFSGLIGAGTWLLSNWWGAPASCIGASGSVFGIMTAAAMAYPDVRMQLLFPPVSVRLKTLAIFFGVYEIFMELSLSSYDNVAHLAHIGGMLGAFIYMRRLAPTFAGLRWQKRVRGWFSSLFQGRSVGSGSSSSDSGGGVRPAGGSRLGGLDSEEVDRVLDKLATSGRSSLTEREKSILEEASRRLKDD